MAASVTPGRALRYAEGSARGLLHQPLGHWPLFILNIRRTAERTGRAAERLEILERNDAIHRQMLDAAARRPRSRDDLLDRLRGGEF